ncbi:type II secretion system minor pseudopilin GspK [Endozoicomonas sp. 8E]|uniref:type II secretion system minor pseudopilin GspK n=1 Tax=Endozoicomonas sp. 8E TaxID=3035692 RepID=UPI00293911BC|nr:type II secretion system minor pseudopilin GspK [Endozoicomonas sp. 8E]WOG28335.1 type II secretion system minor pseudopilin GspK [Endozoicomonas sp. 8E]
MRGLISDKKNTTSFERRQSGVALLIVMFVLTLMVLIAAEITFGFFLQMRRTASLQQMEQARWYALSGEELAVKVLQDEFDESEETVNLGQTWATGEVTFPVDGGAIKGEISDAQACLNLNALQAPDKGGQTSVEVKVFQSLMEVLGIEPYLADRIAQSTRDWIDNDDTQGSGTGAEDSYYQSLPVPYLASNTSMRSASELRAVKGVNARIMRRVEPYLCALPTAEMNININTLSPDHASVLSALYLGELPIEQAKEVLEQRPEDGWQSVDEFIQQPSLSNFSAENTHELMSVDSQYFVMNATASYADSKVRVKSLLRREEENKFSVIRREFGGLE